MVYNKGKKEYNIKRMCDFCGECGMKEREESGVL